MELNSRSGESITKRYQFLSSVLNSFVFNYSGKLKKMSVQCFLVENSVHVCCHAVCTVTQIEYTSVACSYFMVVN